MNEKDSQRSWLLLGCLSVALLVGVPQATVSGALAQNKSRAPQAASPAISKAGVPSAPAASGDMPVPAPSFKRGADSQNMTGNDLPSSSIMVVPRRHLNDKSPHSNGPADSAAQLQGNVQRSGAGGMLQGTVDRTSSSTNAVGPLQGAVDRAGLMRVPPIFDARTETVPPQVFRSWVEKTHPRFSLTLSSSPDLAVIDVKGQWDKADRTLRNMGIPHKSVRAGALKDMDLSSTKVLVINCAGNVPRETLQKVRDYVAAGGCLITTDWALHNLVERAFPGYVMWNGGKSDQKIVDAAVVDPDPALFAGAVDHAAWKLDDESWTLRVLNSNVRVLVKSEKLARDDPDRLGILAVTFPFGRGKILHMVGHFDNNAFFAITNQLPDPSPHIGISLRQALAGNFVLSALQRRW